MDGWLVDAQERNAWQLPRDGRNILDRVTSRYRSGELEVRRCYLWTPKFKKHIDPAYEPSDRDRVRPEDAFLGF